MKKLPLALVTTLTLFLSCKKETTPPQELPAVQKFRDVTVKSWELGEKSLLQIPVTFNEKLKPEFENYATDSSIMVTCRVKFKGDPQEYLLPHTVAFLGGVKHYFFTLAGGKPKILFMNSSMCEFSGSDGSGALPMEQVSFNFTKISLE